MEEFAKILTEHWNSDDCAEARSVIKGGMWPGEAKFGAGGSDDQDKDLYVVFIFLDGSTTELMGTANRNLIEEPTIQFSIFAPNEEDGKKIMQARDEFVRCHDNFTGEMQNDADDNVRTHYKFNRITSGSLIKDPDEGYFVVLTYEAEYIIGA